MLFKWTHDSLQYTHLYKEAQKHTIYVIPTVDLYIYIVRKVLFAYSYFLHLFLFLISPSQSNFERKTNFRYIISPPRDPDYQK